MFKSDALTQVGVSASDAVIAKKAWEFDNGTEKYAIKFIVPGQTKFDCDIDVVTSELTESDAAAIALKDAGFSENDVNITDCYKGMDYDD